MKKIMLGLVALLVFQLCTSEMSEINGVIGEHIDSDPIEIDTETNTLVIPTESFLVQYFSTNSKSNISIATRVENRISHDFNSLLKTDLGANELSAKWTGDFYFESGDYDFSVNSDKGIKLIIDNHVVLNEIRNTVAAVFNFKQQLDGVHRIVVEYNLEYDITIDPDATDRVVVDPIPADPMPSDPVVEQNTDTPTTEIIWTPHNEKAKFTFQYKDNFTSWNTPPWGPLNGMEGVVEIDKTHSLSDGSSLRMYLEAKTGYKNARAQSEWRGGGGTGIPMRLPPFSEIGTSFAVFFPGDYKADPSDEIIFQHHGYKDSHDDYMTTPPYAIGARDGNLWVHIYAISKDPSFEKDKQKFFYFDLAEITPGEWHHFVVNIYWDYRVDGKGYCRTYMKKGSPPTSANLLNEHLGPNCYNDVVGMHPIINVYKWPWNHDSKAQRSMDAGVTKREWWFDNFVYQDAPIVLQ